ARESETERRATAIGRLERRAVSPAGMPQPSQRPREMPSLAVVISCGVRNQFGGCAASLRYRLGQFMVWAIWIAKLADVKTPSMSAFDWGSEIVPSRIPCNSLNIRIRPGAMAQNSAGDPATLLACSIIALTSGSSLASI